MAIERTRTAELAEKLRDRIVTDMKSDDKLPGEAVLADEYGVSRETIRRAFNRLESEGLVQTVGRARFVRLFPMYEWRPDTFEHRDHRRDEPGSNHDAFTGDVAAIGREASQYVEVTIVPAPDLVAQRLELDQGTTVVVRKRRRDIDGTPWQLADSYYPLSVAEGTPIMQPGDVTVPGGLMKASGHEQARFHDEITVRLATPEEVGRLDLPATTPVAQHVRTGYDAAGMAVRVIVTIAPGDRHKIIYDVTA